MTDDREWFRSLLARRGIEMLPEMEAACLGAVAELRAHASVLADHVDVLTEPAQTFDLRRVVRGARA